MFSDPAYLNSFNPKSVIFRTQRLSTTQFDDFNLPWHRITESWRCVMPWANGYNTILPVSEFRHANLIYERFGTQQSWNKAEQDHAEGNIKEQIRKRAELEKCRKGKEQKGKQSRSGNRAERIHAYSERRADFTGRRRGAEREKRENKIVFEFYHTNKRGELRL